MTTTKDKTKEASSWLKRKGLSIRNFSDVTGVDYNTAYKWFKGVNPHPSRLAQKLVRQSFPDFPLLDPVSLTKLR